MPATVFIRHAESIWNRALDEPHLMHDIAHLTDGEFPLTDSGADDARAIAGVLDGVDADLHCSSYLRAQTTAQLIHPSYYWQVDDCWRERGWGDWSHLRWSQREERADSDIRAMDYMPPGDGGESKDMVLERVQTAMQTVLNPQRNKIIVAHGGVMMMAAVATDGQPPIETLPNLSMMRIEDGQWRYYEPGDRAAVADMVV